MEQVKIAPFPLKPSFVPAEVTHRHGKGLELAMAFIDQMLNNKDLNSDQVQVLDELSQSIHEAMAAVGFEMSGAEMVAVRVPVPAVPYVSTTPPVAQAVSKPEAGIPTRRPRSANQVLLEEMNQRVLAARETEVDHRATCPNCEETFYKPYHASVFCSNQGTGNCKDAFYRKMKKIRNDIAVEQANA